MCEILRLIMKFLFNGHCKYHLVTCEVIMKSQVLGSVSRIEKLSFEYFQFRETFGNYKVEIIV